LKKLLAAAIIAALVTGVHAQPYSFDGINNEDWIVWLGASNGIAENTVLANLNPIQDIDVALYNSQSNTITGAALTLTIFDSTATDPLPGGPGNVLYTQTYTLGAIPDSSGTLGTICTLPTGLLNLPTTNVWTAVTINDGLGLLVNINPPTVGTAPPKYFAENLPGTGWIDNAAINFGTTPPYFGIRYDVEAAPEPVSVGILLCSTIGLIRRKRRAAR